ncbi:hypothetical protein NCC49_003223 [Naganishia albida]|nr:hypothetical protein NCC49_003223 [Naganishia albida]
MLKLALLAETTSNHYIIQLANSPPRAVFQAYSEHSSCTTVRQIALDVPSANNADAGPWSARSKTIDVPRPRIAGLKSPLPSAPTSAPPSVPGVADEEAVLEELKAWGFAEEKVCEVELTGREECVGMARVLVLVLMDELNGLAQDTIEIDHRLQYIIAGRKRQTINAIQEETNTNIYLAPTTSTVFLPYATVPREMLAQSGAEHLSSPVLGIESNVNGFPLSPMPAPGRGTMDLPSAFVPSSVQPATRGPSTASPRPTAADGLQDSIARLCISPAPVDSLHMPQTAAYSNGLMEMKDMIWITGDAVGVMSAKEMLSRLAFAKKQTVFTKEAAFVPRKLDWIATERFGKISRIMLDNGSH